MARGSLMRAQRSLNGGKNGLFNKWCQNNWKSTYNRMKLNPELAPYTKINSKGINAPNVGTPSIKKGENVGGKYLCI